MGENGPGRGAEGRGLIDASAGASPRFYGRRRGRPLRPGRAALLETLLPELATPDPADGPLDPAGLFAPAVSDVWLEIGFGAGEHLVAQASARPDIGLIGAEPFVAGVTACLAAIEAAGVANVRIHADDARPLMTALPEASIGRAFVLQPDPWRKRRHWNRRLIGPEGLDQLAHVLKDGAELRVSTDHAGYQVWMLRHLLADSRFAWTAKGAADWREPPADWPKTRYAAKAEREGRPVAYLTFRRLPRGA